MTVREFKSAMQRGLGRCVLELKNNENIEKYRETVLWGCTHPISFDTQCEGTRAEYLYRLLSFFPEKEKILEVIAEKFSAASGKNMWLFQQLYELLCLFAKDGYAVADAVLSQKRAELYTRLLHKKSFNYYDYTRDLFNWLTAHLIMQKDEAFAEKAVSDLGALFLKNSRYDLRDFDETKWELEEKFGKEEFPELLARRTDSPEWSRFADEYRNMIKNDRENRLSAEKKISEARTRAVTAEQVVEAIERGDSFSQIISFRNADGNEKKRLATYLEREDDPEKKAEMLRLWFRGNYPGDHDLLISYAASGNEKLAWAARNVLLNSRSEMIYRYTKERFRGNRADTDAIGMLLMNYREEDKEDLLSALRDLKIKYDNGSDWHGIAFRIVEAAEKDVSLPEEFYQWVYEASLCSNCRTNAVKELAKRGALTSEQIEECRYDSRSEIVEFIIHSEEEVRSE